MQLHHCSTPHCRPYSLIGSRNCAVVIAAFFFISQAYADERRESDSPFKIEDFAPKKGRYTLNAGIGYSVADSKNVSVSTIAIPLSHGYSLLLPDVTLDNRRRDSAFTRLGMRYALSDGLNANVGFKADASRSVIRENSSTRTEHDSGWRSLTAGFDYRLTSPFNHPFILAFSEIALAENIGGSTLHGKTATFGLSSHWAFDPVILSLTGTYSFLGARQDNGKTYDPGDVLGLAASFGFAINPEITLRAGFAQGFRGGDKIDGKKGDWGSNSSFTLGYIHRLSPKLVMNIDAQVGVAGSDTAQFLANFTWRP